MITIFIYLDLSKIKEDQTFKDSWNKKGTVLIKLG